MIEHKQAIVKAGVKWFFKKEHKELFEDWMRDLVKDMGMNLLAGPISAYVDRDELRGWSGSCLIETSHVAIHVWDEHSPILIQADIYTCGAMNFDVILKYLEHFEIVERDGKKDIEYLLLDREYKLEVKGPF